MKKLYFAAFLFFLLQAVNAQYKYDTVYTKPIGTGMIYTKYVTASVPWSMGVVEVDLKNSYNSLESVKGKDNIVGREVLSSMIKRTSKPGHKVIAAINSDFFDLGTGTPINIQVKNGEILRNPITLSVIGFDANKKPMLDIVKYTGAFITKNGTNAINGVNTTRGTDQMILFNKLYGTATGTNIYGTELLLNPIDGWSVNDTVRCVVASKVSNAGNMVYNSSQVVISAHGTSQTFVNTKVNVGDTVKVVNTLKPGIPKIKEMLGGYPRIVNDGKNYADQGYINEGGPDHTYLNEPRTAIGFSKDSTKLYLVIVDGRNPSSLGMTLPQLADFMISFGVYQGMNFDGGGSTELIVRDSIMNIPSDGAERALANALLISTSAPEKGTFAKLKISPSGYKIFKGGAAKQFSVEGFDEYSNPAAVNSSQVVYSVSGGIGTITPAGLFTPAGKAATGYVYASYNGIKDSAFVVVKTLAKVTIEPKNPVTDFIRNFQFRLKMYDTDDVQYYLGTNEFSWKVSDTEIGTIDTMGIFKGKKTGTAKVIVSYENISDTSTITVQNASGLKMVEGFDNLSAWTLKGENIDTAATKMSISSQEHSQGTSSVRIDYKFKGDPSLLNWVYLDGDLPIYGVPDSIKIDGKSDGQKHVVSYLLSDENGETFNLNTTKYMDVSTSFDSLGASFFRVAGVSPSAVFDFPVRVKQIKVKLGSAHQLGQTYTGTIYLDNLRVTYPSVISGVELEETIPVNFNLMQNYPNPFNPTTTIEFSTVKSGFTELKIFDLLGRELESLVKENLSAGKHKVVWNASNYPSGVYFYQLRVNEQKSVRKMILVR